MMPNHIRVRMNASIISMKKESNPSFPPSATVSAARQAVNRAVFAENSRSWRIRKSSPNRIGTGQSYEPTERTAGQKKERSGLQSARDELIDKGAFITGE
jgi:hypothetical protein